MKIATWNIGEDERNKDRKLNLSSYEYIVNTIKNEEIDIICLQEAITDSKDLPSIAKYIKENTNLHFIVEFELSDSHINIGSKMGVAICSKYEIEKYTFLKLENPELTYKESENKTYFSHDKGFIMAKINDCILATGHCLPFHIFKKSPLDYLDIYEKIEKEFLEALKENNSFILCGDFNYENVSDLFPVIMQNCIDLIDCPTRKEKQLDHFIISKNLECTSKNIQENIFDHKLGIFHINS